MRVGIMQPYFFPYLGHFALIANVERWLVFDITQYTPKTWMNRNRILHPSGGPQYVTVALANSSISIKTSEARVLDMQASRSTVLGKLTHYRKTAPHYSKVLGIVDEAFAAAEGDLLVDLNVSALTAVTRYLGIPFRYDICSRMDLDIPADLGAGQWAAAISQSVGADEYVNPIGGRDLFAKEEFVQRGLGLLFLEYDTYTYAARNMTFEPNLSILDVLMWNTPEQVLSHIEAGARLVRA